MSSKNKIKMLKKIYNYIYSTKTMGIAVVVFFVAMAIATFIENNYGTPSAKALIYNTKWFELIMLLLVVNFIGNIFKFRLFKKEKWPVFLFHVAFIIILLGSFITRYYSYEGIMPIREGAKSNFMYSDKTYISARVDNDSVMKTYTWPVLFNEIGNKSFYHNVFGLNKFNKTDVFGQKNTQKFRVELLSFTPNAKESLTPDEKGDLYMHLVTSGTGIRNNIFIKSGDIKSIQNILYTLNNPIDGAMNFISKDGKNQLKPASSGTTMVMQTQQTSPVVKDSIQPLYFNQLYSFDNQTNFVIKNIAKGKIVKETANKNEQASYPYDALKLKITSNNESKTIDVKGVSGGILKPERLSIGGLNFNLNYGSTQIKMPFDLALRDFEMERYPGSNSPSSFASEVTVLDKDHTFDFRIYMNHVLDYKGYRFYQSSYDEDEKGTILSVNHDHWGTFITYLGYFLMTLGMFFTLFWKGTRFQKLSDKVKKISKNKFGIFILALVLSQGVSAQKTSMDISKNVVNKEHADKFGKLLILDHQGRVKPINSYALDVLRKIYKKDYFKEFTAEQVILSAQVKPSFWAHQKIITSNKYALGSRIAKELNIGDDKLVNLVDFFDKDKHYKLANLVEISYRKKKSARDGSDNEIIKLDEKFNIWLSVLNGGLMNIYPKKDDPNNKWYNGFDNQTFSGQDTMILKMHQLYITELNKAIETGDYKTADEYLNYISDYQKNIGADVIPNQKKIDLEILYNKWNIFKWLLFYYMLVGFVFLGLAFANLFNPQNKIVQKSLGLFTILTIIGMAFHVFGMGVRWYISGHEPWSNGYEAVVFVAFVTILAGLIFSIKKSKFTLAATVVFSSFLLGIAHGSTMNPEITNLVPVLKSYWLMIHVAVITSSYGFLGLSALLGFIVLLLFILRNNKNASKLKDTINELTAINEMSMIVGLFMLSLGTFLGGVWANESWGRYWSWDPKEVWSLISMMVYIFILHMRLIPGLKGKFAFNLASLFSISTLIMTFFGVNYYLAGMHSYAKGDPVPIPIWIPISVALFILFAFVSYIKYKDFQKKQ